MKRTKKGRVRNDSALKSNLCAYWVASHRGIIALGHICYSIHVKKKALGSLSVYVSSPASMDVLKQFTLK